MEQPPRKKLKRFLNTIEKAVVFLLSILPRLKERRKTMAFFITIFNIIIKNYFVMQKGSDENKLPYPRPKLLLG